MRIYHIPETRSNLRGFFFQSHFYFLIYDSDIYTSKKSSFFHRYLWTFEKENFRYIATIYPRGSFREDISRCRKR